MVHTVSWLPHHLHPATDNETLLDAAQRHGFTLPFSCLNGNCERCRSQLLSGTVLTPDGIIEAGETPSFILPCSAIALTDLKLDNPALLPPATLPLLNRACQLAALDSIEGGCWRLLLRTPAAGGLPLYFAGQSARLEFGNEQIELYFRAPVPNQRLLEFLLDPMLLDATSLLDWLSREPVIRCHWPYGDVHAGKLADEQSLLIACDRHGFAGAASLAEWRLQQRPGPVQRVEWLWLTDEVDPLLPLHVSGWLLEQPLLHSIGQIEETLAQQIVLFCAVETGSQWRDRLLRRSGVTRIHLASEPD